MDIERSYRIQSRSFFLFGPRGVGKSTWIRKTFSVQLTIDLLRSNTFLELQRNPSLLEAKAGHLKPGETVFIDEIQKLPELLDEVHRLMEDQKIEFILTGSSARKLKRAGANLLAGRAHSYKMYPFSLREISHLFCLEDLLNWGTLPVVLRDTPLAEETLSAYVDTYLREEIKEEALTRDLSEFSRFLSISASLNAQVLNFDSISRETSKSNKTVQSWYQILEETLLGYRVKPYRPGFKVRESGHSKFFWFDPGVARVASGLNWRDVDGHWKGFAFESIILREIFIYLEVSRKRLDVYYYGTPGAGEVDFVVETSKKTPHRPQQFVSIEVKYSTRWKREFEGPSRSLLQASPNNSHQRMIGVYTGLEELTFDGFSVLPVGVFLEKMYLGQLF